MRFVVRVERKAAKSWSVAAPSFPGCNLRAESREEALDEIKKSIKARLETMAARRLSVTVEVLPFYIISGREGMEITSPGEREQIAALIAGQLPEEESGNAEAGDCEGSPRSN